MVVGACWSAVVEQRNLADLDVPSTSTETNNPKKKSPAEGYGRLQYCSAGAINVKNVPRNQGTKTDKVLG